MAASPKNKCVAAHVLSAFGGKPVVHAFHHDVESLKVDILQCADRPQEGVISYSTLGLSDYAMGGSLRVEIAGACAADKAHFANILASAAFSVMRGGSILRPGACLAGFVSEYYPMSTVPHLYFTSPFFLGEDSLCALEVQNVTVAWVLAVPISARERDFLMENGDQALEDLLESGQIDIFDLGRKCSIT